MIQATVNLARHPVENRRRVWALWGGGALALTVLLCVLSAVAASGWVRTRAVERQTTALHDRIATLEARQNRLAMQLQDPVTRSALNNAQYLNALLDRKATSWTLLFERLERILPDNVELVSLRPMQRGEADGIDLIFASDSPPPAIELIERLENSGDFAEAQLERVQTRQQTGEAGAGAVQGPKFQFEVTALYRPQAEKTRAHGTEESR